MIAFNSISNRSYIKHTIKATNLFDCNRYGTILAKTNLFTQACTLRKIFKLCTPPRKIMQAIAQKSKTQVIHHRTRLLMASSKSLFHFCSSNGLRFTLQCGMHKKILVISSTICLHTYLHKCLHPQ